MQWINATDYGLEFEVMEMTFLFCFFTEALHVWQKQLNKPTRFNVQQYGINRSTIYKSDTVKWSRFFLIGWVTNVWKSEQNCKSA